MAKYSKLYAGLIVFLLSFTVGTISFAQEEAKEAEKPTCDASLTFYSKYVWRGFELSKNSLVIFPEITVSYKGFGFTLWGDFDTDYEGDQTGSNSTEWWETDMVITYSNSFDKLNYTLGWIYYDVDAGEDEELYIVLGYDMFLSPEISVWKGIEYSESSWYINFALTHSFELENGHSLDVGGWVGYYDWEDADLDGSDYNEWHDATIWLGYNIPLNDWCTVSPSINYSFPLSSGSEDFLEAASFDGDDSDFFYGGVTLSVSF